jgi:hypothetical protein
MVVIWDSTSGQFVARESAVQASLEHCPELASPIPNSLASFDNCLNTLVAGLKVRKDRMISKHGV